jgi:fatty-acyl-CoA synthase/feruloyl-CoA synthase
MAPRSTAGTTYSAAFIFPLPYPGQTITLEELRDFGAGRLTAYKLPRELILRPLPRNPSGKVLKHVLRAGIGKHPRC